MPFLMMLAGVLLNLVGSVIGRALLALGMSFVTYKGMDVGIEWLFDGIRSNIGSMPPAVIQLFGFLWVDKAISMIFAAYTAAAVIKMAGGNSITKLVTKGSA